MMLCITRIGARHIAGRIWARAGPRGVRARLQIGGCLPLRNS